MTTFRERVHEQVVRAATGRASIPAVTDAVLALCEDGGTPDAWMVLDRDGKRYTSENRTTFYTIRGAAERLAAKIYEACPEAGMPTVVPLYRHPEGARPDAWRTDPKVQACIGNLRAQGCCMEDYGAMGAEDVILEGRKHFDALLDALCAAVAAAGGGARDAGADTRLRDALETVATIYERHDSCSVLERSQQAYDMRCVARAALSPSPEPTNG